MTGTYPLEPGGVDDYPVHVGSALLTLVDPSRGFERAYNRWYERDHFYGGCMVGAHCFAGSRWVAPRRLKDLRWPQGGGVASANAIADPWDAGSYVAVYWCEAGHHHDLWEDWASKQVRWLYSNGRGFSERHHVHTILYHHLAAVYRDADPVPIDLALDTGYDALVLAWLDAAGDVDAADLHGSLAAELAPAALAGSPIESVSSWRPSPGQDRTLTKAPMDLGSGPGGAGRLLQMFFVRGDVEAAVAQLHRYTEAVEDAGLASVLLVAPFVRTIPGTDTYVDELW